MDAKEGVMAIDADGSIIFDADDEWISVFVEDDGDATEDWNVTELLRFAVVSSRRSSSDNSKGLSRLIISL